MQLPGGGIFMYLYTVQTGGINKLVISKTDQTNILGGFRISNKTKKYNERKKRPALKS